MKKQLLASTMLVAAGALTASGAAEAKIDVTVNGYFEAVVGAAFGSDEDTYQKGGAPTLENPTAGGNGTIGNTSAIDQHNEMEIHFNARTELDNGIKLRAHVELEGNAGLTESGPRGTQDVIDEQYLIIRGNFGQLTLGSEDNAGHLMTIGYMGSWATGVGQNLTFDVGDWVTRPYTAKFDGALNDPRLRDGDNDSNKITYYTPRFAGFQVGASYIPNNTQDQDGSVASTDTAYHDGYAFGVNFQRKFDQFGIGTGFGYLHMNAPGISTNRKDGRSWAAALRLDFGPFRIAGGVNKVINLREGAGNVASTNLSGTIYDIGGRLTFGPNRFSLAYASGDCSCDPNTVAERREDALMLSYARTLGPGVKWTVNGIYGNFKGDENPGVVTAVTTGGQESESFALTTSVRMNF